MSNQLTMQKKSRYISFFLLLCILVNVIAVIYVIYGMAKHNDPQQVFTGLNWQSDYTGISYGYICVVIIRTLAIILALVFAFTIFHAIGKGTSPFSNVISKRIRSIGILLIVAATIAWPVGSLISTQIWPDEITYPILINIDWGMLTFGFIISCLASIFQYGCILQQESDETL